MSGGIGEIGNRKNINRVAGWGILSCFIIGMQSILLLASPSFADDSLSGRLVLRGVEELDDESAPEDPGISGRIKLDVDGPAWLLHSWLEGGTDGTVRRPKRDNSLFRSYDEVYQDNTPYLEFKELYVARSIGDADIKLGIQRFTWGRLDEFPPNDLLNPWDYSQFIRKSLEDRKIGVPSVSGTLNSGDRTYEAVWQPFLVPYRLAMPDERWSGTGISSKLSQMPNAEVIPQEPDLPEREFKHGNLGLRTIARGEVEWAVNMYHGYDPRPVFRTTGLVIVPLSGKLVIDPGYEPSFHRITALGLDAAAVRGDFSLRAETAYVFNKYYNTRTELWGYPAAPTPGAHPLNPIEVKSDTLEYGIGFDYRPFEDGMITAQAQQTMILRHRDTLYERNIETLIWANLKVGWMNQKLETSAILAYNPEHGAHMAKAGASYVFTDYWKAGLTAVFFNGPEQSSFGRYSANDQVDAELTYSW